MLGRVFAVACTSLMFLALAGCSGEEDQGSSQPASAGEEVLFEDDFSDSASGWRVSGSGDAVRAYEDGGYRITPGQPGVEIFSFAPGGEDFEDVSVEVDVSTDNGPDDLLFGIACRVQDDQNFYSLGISRGGDYGIRKRKDGEDEKFVRYSQQPSAIQQGEAVNSLRADCVGDTMILYANDEELLRLRDDEFRSGGVALNTQATPRNRPGADVLFDNFVVRQVDPSTIPSSGTPEAPPPEGEVVNEDDFSEPASGWESGGIAGGSAGYADGAYRLSGNPAFISTATHLGNFADTSVEADVTQLEGPENSALGIVCRANAGDTEYLGYLLYLTNDGAMGIVKRRANGPPDRLAVARNIGSFAPGIGQTNRLRADCVGRTLTLSIDGEKLLEVEDDSISGAGEVGFLVDNSTQDEPVVAQFDDFVLRAP